MSVSPGTSAASAVNISGSIATYFSPSNPAITTPYFYRSDTFTGTGNGTIVNASLSPVKAFTVLTRATGGTPTLWTVVLEGSLDGTNFSTILTHNNTLGLNVNMFSGAVLSPCRYFRSRVVALTLGLATNIIVDILGSA